MKWTVHFDRTAIIQNFGTFLLFVSVRRDTNTVFFESINRKSKFVYCNCTGNDAIDRPSQKLCNNRMYLHYNSKSLFKTCFSISFASYASIVRFISLSQSFRNLTSSIGLRGMIRISHTKICYIEQSRKKMLTPTAKSAQLKFGRKLE